MSRALVDTIVAPITAYPGPVATVRVCGPEAWRIATALAPGWTPQAQVASVVNLPLGEQAVLLPFATGRSYTGDETVEISTHGSIAAVRAVVEACVSLGARSAIPGEFSQRAFMNGRIDLVQAEAIRDLIEAESERQMRNANRIRSGELSSELGSIRSELLHILAALEASVDFSEEIGPFDRITAAKTLGAVLARVDVLLASADTSRWIRNGIRVAIVGPPNAGKSSLLNRILGRDRAIVTEMAGTTRDTLEETVEIDGIKVVLIDTAGLRATSDRIESLGIQRTNMAAIDADFVWYVFDGQVGLGPADHVFAQQIGGKVLFVHNKADLTITQPAQGIQISAKTGFGVDVLEKWVSDTVQPDAYRLLIAPRHGIQLSLVREALEEARRHLGADTPLDLISVLISDALSGLGMITGETASENMLETIFRQFCIGK